MLRDRRGEKIVNYQNRHATSPGRDARDDIYMKSIGLFSFAPVGLELFGTLFPNDESLGYFRPSLTGLK